jgi:predicted PurR-regulated permease PerM
MADLATGWVDAVGRRFRASAALALAETRLALSSFILMLFLTVLAAGALLFAWGYSPIATAFALAVVHLGLAYALWRLANSLGQHMEFTETRRLLASMADDDTGAGDEP